MSMDTSVPRQRDTSDAALVDMLMLEAPVGLALFGPDLRFRWVNAALTRLGGQAEADPSGPSHPSGPLDWAGRLPSEAWPPHVAARAEVALRKVLDEGVPLTERGYPAVRPPASPAENRARTLASASGSSVAAQYLSVMPSQALVTSQVCDLASSIFLYVSSCRP